MAPLRTLVVTALCLGRAAAGPGLLRGTRRGHEEAANRSLLVGGWCQGAGTVPCTWGSEATVILPGAFQRQAASLPKPENWQGQATYQEVWLTFGGVGVGLDDPDKCFSASFIATSAKELDATGVCFDMEGCYKDQLTKLQQTIAEVKKINATLQFMFTPQGDISTVPPYAGLEDTFDAISPMLYWGAKSYQPKPTGSGITCDMIETWANNWAEKGWPKAKTYLTFQSMSAHTSSEILTSCLKPLAESGGYRGLLGWPVSPPTSATSAIDQANLALIIGGGSAPSPALTLPTRSAEPASMDLAAVTEASYEIVIKAPSAGSLSPAEAIASTCAEGFNAAYAKCLGGKNSYLMHIFTDASGKAYCGYQGGWAIPSQYPDHSACFASPGFSEALFYDTTKKSLITWDKKVKATEVAMYNGPSLNCAGEGSKPCSANVVVKNRRKVTINQQTQEIDKDYSFTWSAHMGYVGIDTITGGTSQVAMYIKNLAAGPALTSDVPCGHPGSVSDQASKFPVKGLESQCASQNDDYYMKFADETITICFPGSAC